MSADVSERDAGTSTPIWRDWCLWALALGVLLTRTLTRGELYFADGPAHLKAIQDRTFLIQPPGYWLFNRLAGIFSNPILAISAFNICCSVLGVIVFYHCARLLLNRKYVAMWAAATYAAVFYAWFSAEIHSTYASQLLFPVLLLWGFLQYDRTQRSAYLYLAVVAFAAGSGFRPSDGVFMLPYVCCQLFHVYPRRRAAIASGIFVVLCLGWLIPTVLGFAGQPWADFTGYVSNIIAMRSVFAQGINRLTLANMLRVFVPLVFAFAPFALLPVARQHMRLDVESRKLLLWILPGLAFFLLIYCSDAPYLDFMTAPIILFIFLVFKNANKQLLAICSSTCIAINTCFFLFFSPVVSQNLAMNVINCYAGRYSLFSLRHRVSRNLSDVVKNPELVLEPNGPSKVPYGP